MKPQVISCEAYDMFPATTHEVTTYYVLWCHAILYANTSFSPSPCDVTSLPAPCATTCVGKSTCVHPCHVVTSSSRVEVDHCNCFVVVLMSFRSAYAQKTCDIALHVSEVRTVTPISKYYHFMQTNRVLQRRTKLRTSSSRMIVSTTPQRHSGPTMPYERIPTCMPNCSLMTLTRHALAVNTVKNRSSRRQTSVSNVMSVF